MGFINLKDVAMNLAMGHLANALTSGASAKDSGKVSAKLMKKSGLDIKDAPNQKVRENPLTFSPVQYPLDLGSNELGHYILFESGFVGYSPQTSTFTTAYDPVYKEVTTTTTVAGVPQLGYSAFDKTTTHHEQIGTEARDFTTEKLTAKTPSHSITTSGIAIYMPPGVKTSYTQDYGPEAAGMAGDIEVGWEGVSGAEGAANKIEAAMRGVISPILRQGKKMLGEGISLAGAGDPIKFAAKRAGYAMNPRDEMFYNSPSHRNFTFTFDFWPRNPKEAEAVEKIIAIFKYNSSPGLEEESSGGVFHIPNYWKISYMYNEKENSHLHKLGACYCTSVEVDYSPDGKWTTTGDGSPVHTKMTVGFVEDRIITKRDIEAGA